MDFLLSCLFLVICCASAQPRQAAEGQTCTLKDGREGICRVISACPSVLATIKEQHPIQCGFKGNTPIVCCGDGAATVTKPAASVPPQNMNPEIAKRKIEAKCKDYSKTVTYTSGVLPLLPEPIASTIETPKCDFGGLPLIVGGEATKLGEFPHMAALGYQQDQWLCGGSLISDQWIMTAAHCITTRAGPPVRARLGEYNLKRDDDGAHPQDFDIIQRERHPDYKPSSKYNDIGLVKLSQPVQFSSFIRPACLYPGDTFYTNKTLASGWGRIGSGLEQSDILLKVGLDIIDNEQCDKLYHSLKNTPSLKVGIAPTMMCAGVLAGGMDTCQGDSGGPIQILSRENQCIYYIIGVTSFGKFCAAANAPGVYTRVSQYLPWIASVVWP